jgi:hypothetical protein
VNRDDTAIAALRLTRKQNLLVIDVWETLLDTVSTTCGSGWVNHTNQARYGSLTHPLPQVVLTVSK